MRKIICICLLITSLLTSCIQDLDDWLKTNDINFKRKSDSKYFSKDYADISVNRIKNDLIIDFIWQKSENFPFPINNTTDTLTVTQFLYKFSENGKTISVNDIKHPKSQSSDWNMDSTQFIITSVQHDLNGFSHDKLYIPMYFFYNLKSGKHEITVDIYEEKFSLKQNLQNQKTSNNPIPEKITTLIKGSITFTLNIPEIYETKIFTNGLELKNDSTFSPSGMDFTLFTAGYPDIYWELFFPVNSESDLSHPYFVSSVARTSNNRLISDTIVLYHYSKADRVIIGVYDQDVITRDDFIGDWFGSLSMFATKDSNFRRISFDNVKWFAIKTELKGVTNK